MRNQDRRFSQALVINPDTKKVKIVTFRRGHINHVKMAYRFHSVAEVGIPIVKAVSKILGREAMSLETFDSVK